MTTVKTTMVQRGHIYKWHEGMPDERFVLTVGADSRGNERAITVLMFNNSGAGRDVVCIRNNLLKDACYVHCGMVTYVSREDMADKMIARVSEKTMSYIDRQLCIQLSITNESVLAELKFYKQKCNELIEKITGIDCDI